MACFPSCYKIIMVTLATTLLLLLSNISAVPIDEDCQQKAFDIVRKKMENAIKNETRMGASLLRLHFHDCFVNGCDGSVLLDDTPNSKGEKGAIPNRNSIRGFEVIDDIKEALEAELPGVVSCADILAIAARDAVHILGGPCWDVNLGRRDSLKASLIAANKGIPPPNSTIEGLTTKFQSLGLTSKDLVALSGAHTIGLARCTSFRDRIYNEGPILLNKDFAKQKQHDCPRTAGTPKDNNTASLDQTPKLWDNDYFINLVAKKGLLHSDQQLYSGGKTDSMDFVQNYANNLDTFNNDFISAMIKMSNINTLTGSKGEIREKCRKINKQ